MYNTPWQYLYGQLARNWAFGDPADEGMGESFVQTTWFKGYKFTSERRSFFLSNRNLG
jgi:hypothetical protein